MKNAHVILLCSSLLLMLACHVKQSEPTKTAVLSEAEKMPVVISARILVKPDSIESFKRIGAEMLYETRKEEGCVQYNLLQDTENPCLFLFFEEYKNKQAQVFHSEQPYLASFRSRRDPMLQEPALATIYIVAEKK